MQIVSSALMMTLRPHLLREIKLDPREHPRGQAHLSACSGLVQLGERWYAVADDEHHLAAFGSAPDEPVALIRIFDGDLPDDVKKRKKRKPDLEVLALLPPDSRFIHGALLALGSGSKAETRDRGALFSLKRDGTPKSPTQINLAPLYAPLRAAFEDLNIEGGFLFGDTFRLLQRGNKGESPSACITYAGHAMLKWLALETEIVPPILQINTIDLGSIDGVPLSITDAAPVAGNAGLWVVSAAAENTDDSFIDGPCVASAIAFLDNDHKVLALHALDGAPKVEGIVATVAAGRVTLTMVTDADDPMRPSEMLRVTVPIPR